VINDGLELVAEEQVQVNPIFIQQLGTISYQFLAPGANVLNILDV
jgi:hypothetical protein